MEYLCIIGLLILIGFTATNGFLRIAGQSLGLSGAAGLAMLFVLGTGCYGFKFLPYSFCGELTGLLHITIVSVFIAIVVFIGTLVVNLRKYKFAAIKKSGQGELK